MRDMNQQYDILNDYVELIAGGKTMNTKSLIVTGAPGCGKSHHVFKKIEELGLKEGIDFCSATGNITVASLYRKLVENLDGLLVFDDCDAVIDDANGINILKGALNTGEVKQVSYDTARSFNTAVMTPDERKIWVESMSRILRNVPTLEDIERFLPYTSYKTPKDYCEVDDFSDDSHIDPIKKMAVYSYVCAHLPNKIDYSGRIIFISNRRLSQWDSAVVSRAYTIDLWFTNQEMLGYIDQIKDHIKSNLTDQQKHEVIEVIRELERNGILTKPVTIRLVQNSFDLRNSPNWLRLIALNVRDPQFYSRV
jgi:hypothetical protein